MRTILLQTSQTIGSTTATAPGLSSSCPSVGIFKDIEGIEHSLIGGTSSSTTAHKWVTLNCWSSGSVSVDGNTYFEIGSNNTPATVEDYCLDSYIQEEDYSASWRAISNAFLVKNKGNLAFSVTITAKKDLNIGEVGMFKYIRGNGNNPARFLLGRAAFEPISLVEGQSVTFQVTIEI